MHLYFPHGRFCFIMPAAFRQPNLPDAIAAERSISRGFRGQGYVLAPQGHPPFDRYPAANDILFH
jgi:hypothetical protein